MTRIKRWFAVLTAGLFLFSWAAAPAEDVGRNTVEIQESLVSRENDTSATLQDHLKLVQELLQTEEVRNLLKFDDVKTIATEVLARVLIWMIQNRPVTMKILTELGIGETDLRCIGKIWDSADRVTAAFNEYGSTDDGQQLIAEFEALKDDPEFLQSLDNFEAMITSRDVASILEAIEADVSSFSKENPEETPLTQEALIRHLNDMSFTGALLLKLFSTLEKSPFVRESLPALLQNENLWTFLMHLSNLNANTDHVLREELMLLSGDPEIHEFTERTATALLDLANKLRSLNDPDPLPENTTEETPEEAAP